MEQKEIFVKSTLDGTSQPSLFYPARGEKRPLLVALHTWSYTRFGKIEATLAYAERYDFNLLFPEFRGPNLESSAHRTEACGSVYAKQDIKDAIDYVVAHEGVDRDNVFLLGMSGGGHMALLMAGFCPAYFKAIGAFVPITDLEKWAEQNPNYRKHVLACCSGSVEEMCLRSPITYADKIAEANLKIFHGKFDPVVPFTHSTELYAKIFERHPDARVFLEIFDGGHEIDMKTAFYWLLSQYEGQSLEAVLG